MTFTLPAGGTYDVTLFVTDDDGGRDELLRSVTLAEDDDVADATVSGTWSGGASGGASCTTGSTGRCLVGVGGIRKNRSSVTFRVDDVAHESLTYDASANTDPDGDSDGASITVSKP